MSDDANEIGASQEDVVTDDELTRAAAELAEKSKPEVEPVVEAEPVIEVELDKPVVEVEPDEALTPQESTRLGRKVAAIDDRMTDMFDRMDQVLEKFEGQPTEVKSETEEDLDEPQLHTTREIRQIVQAEKGLDAKAWDEFNDEIAKQGATVKDNNEMFQKVCDEISANHMPRDARRANAELIYSQAKNAVLSKMVAQPLEKVNPLKGKEPDNPLGKLPEEKVPSRDVPEITLTEDEIRGAAGLGVSEEEFKKMIAEGGGEDLQAATQKAIPL